MLDEKVIVIDDSGSDGEGSAPTTHADENSSSKSLRHESEKDLLQKTDTLVSSELKKTDNCTGSNGLDDPRKPSKNTANDEMNCRDTNISAVPGTEKPNNPLDLKALLTVLETSDKRPALKSTTIRVKKRRPSCCNFWCDNNAVIVPEESIRDYYNIPKGKSFKICEGCVNSYHNYLISAEENLEKSGNLLEGRCPNFNEFIILEDESDEEEEIIDPEMEKLLGNAINESLNELNKQVSLNKIFERSRVQVYKKLEHFIEVGKEVVIKLSSIQSDLNVSFDDFNNGFKTKVHSLAELDIPYDENLSAFEVINVVKKKRSSSNVKSQLPLKVGDLVHARGETAQTEWLPYKLTDIIYSTNEHGKFVETFKIESNELKLVVDGDTLAHNIAPGYKLTVGTRVVGAYTKASGGDEPKKWYAGMVAENPSSANDNRYLLFFDDGKASYCSEADVKLVYKPSKPIYEYFVSRYQAEFVQNYLNKFPERPMLKATPKNFIRVERDGFWFCSKVVKVDVSLVYVTFLNDDTSEWIYRGSTRLRPVYDRLSAFMNKAKNNQAKPVMLPKPRRSDNDNFSAIVIDLSSDDDDDGSRSSTQSVRAVAKKSTSRPPTYYPKPTMDKRKSRTSVIRKLPTIMQTPLTYHFHKCSIACVNWVKYTEAKTEGVNPLAIPSIFAFKREIDVTSSVSYTSPCGKKLKNIQEVLKYLSETLIPLTLDMFDFDIRTQIFDEFIVSSSSILVNDISDGREKNPIPCINDLDFEFPDLMSYMTERRSLEGVDINLDPGFLVCCDCEDNCRDRSKCRCWRLTIDNFKPFNIGEEKRHITKIGYQYQRLDQNLLSGIYECNSNCHCNAITCINRVVQHPIKHKLQLFKTHKKGWGTRCVNDIPQGVFICTYVGNLMTEPSANETGTINGDEFFAELDHIEVMEESKADYEAQAARMTDEEEEYDDYDDDDERHGVSHSTESTSDRALRSCRKRKQDSQSGKKSVERDVVDISDDEPANNSESDEEGDSVRKYYGPNETVYVMDAKLAGNIGRYFNHSCDPNVFVQNVYVDTHDLRFPWVAFFALKHIPAGTELTWDYGYKINSVPGKILYCYCGSHNCRKRLL